MVARDRIETRNEVVPTRAFQFIGLGPNLI